MGAITSGRSTCGILVGCSVAIGLRCGREKEGIPEEYAPERNLAISATSELYREFLTEFGTAECRALTGCDFSKPADIARYTEEKIGVKTCGKLFRFAMTKCVEMAEAGTI